MKVYIGFLESNAAHLDKEKMNVERLRRVVVDTEKMIMERITCVVVDKVIWFVVGQ